MNKPVILMIMDGYGLSDKREGNAVALADTKNIAKLTGEYPNGLLSTHGLSAGLPEGQMGNSEVGHLNLGAGRVVYQSLSRINKSIEDNEFYSSVVKDAIKYCKENDKKLHIMGLLSDGGVHAHINHIKELLSIGTSENVKTYLHAFLDGRDVGPKTALGYVEQISDKYKIASVSGRFYAMDRDKNLDRTKKAIDAMFGNGDSTFSSAKEGIENSYNNSLTDEFVVPFTCDKDGTIDKGDVVLFANFRPDRAIQISTMLNELGFEKNYLTMTKYNSVVKSNVLFSKQNLDDTLGDVLSKRNFNQLRIAETEKYAHVTLFFDGGVDKELKGAKRILIPSPKVETYDMKPEMSAYEIADKCINEIKNENFDVCILNFANCDMVGHTGNLDAAIKSVEVVDELVGKIYEEIKAKDGICIITADHGNAEQVINDDGSIHTAHTTNLVPFIITNKDYKVAEQGALCDVAVTILDILGEDIPNAMTGNSLIKSKK